MVVLCSFCDQDSFPKMDLVGWDLFEKEFVEFWACYDVLSISRAIIVLMTDHVDVP